MRNVVRSTLLGTEDETASVEKGKNLELVSIVCWFEGIDTEDNPLVSKEDSENKSSFWEWNKSLETKFNTLFEVEKERKLKYGYRPCDDDNPSLVVAETTQWLFRQFQIFRISNRLNLLILLLLWYSFTEDSCSLEPGFNWLVLSIAVALSLFPAEFPISLVFMLVDVTLLTGFSKLTMSILLSVVFSL